FNVSIAEGNADIQVTPVATNSSAPAASPVSNGEGTEVPAAVNGAVWKILVKEGDVVEADQQIMILEAMKMEIDINAPVAGTITKILVGATDSVEEGQPLAIIG
ncbi:MAG: biotin/lipoyl-containing protein, partial [Poseidonibacter sp.]